MQDMQSSEVLARRIEDRKKLVKRIITFVESLLLAQGTITKRYVGSAHTHTVRELKDFGGFSFVWDNTQTMFGGTDIEVVYTRTQELVFAVYYQASVDECVVKRFEPHPDWLKDLRLLMRVRNTTRAIQEKKRKNQEKCVVASVAKKTTRLFSEAQRLGL